MNTSLRRHFFALPRRWIVETALAFRSQLGSFASIALFSFFTTSLLRIIPMFGEVIGSVWMSFCTVFLAYSLRDAQQGKRISYMSLATLLKTQPTNIELFTLGVIFALMQNLFTLVISLTLHTGGSDTINVAEYIANNSTGMNVVTIGLFLLTVIITAMCSIFAPLFVTNQGFRSYKAIFYSFFTVYKYWRPMIGITLAYIATSIVLGLAFVALLFITQSPQLTVFIVPIPVAFLFGFWQMMSWCMYRDLVGLPEEPLVEIVD